MVYLIVCSACLILFREVPRNVLIFPLFWEIVQRINRHHLRLKRSSNTQSTFSSRGIFFRSLGSIGTFALCYLIQVGCLDSPLSKLSMMVWKCVNKISRKKRIIVIGEYIIYRSSCWYSASWAEDVRKEKGRVH